MIKALRLICIRQHTDSLWAQTNLLPLHPSTFGCSSFVLCSSWTLDMMPRPPLAKPESCWWRLLTCRSVCHLLPWQSPKPRKAEPFQSTFRRCSGVTEAGRIATTTIANQKTTNAGFYSQSAISGSVRLLSTTISHVNHRLRLSTTRLTSRRNVIWGASVNRSAVAQTVASCNRETGVIAGLIETRHRVGLHSQPLPGPPPPPATMCRCEVRDAGKRLMTTACL